MGIKIAILEKDGVEYGMPVEYTLQPIDLEDHMPLNYTTENFTIPEYRTKIIGSGYKVDHEITINGALWV